ncbi:alpha/beta hydrolase [Streptomyces sp. NPDC050388]|uniref:alpha/beta fold hydrolase n=1 Tax=Streptomyces sp. NPDC050388 TaxID=3155781 RepID=UPI003425E02C
MLEVGRFPGGSAVTWPERVVVRDGVRHVCRDRSGPGQSLVLLHGLAGHAGEWDVLARRLSSRHRVVAVDHRGHGAGERHPRDVSRAAYVADVIAIVDQPALRRPVLVGQSPGGHTACSPPPRIPGSSTHSCSSRPAPAVHTRPAPDRLPRSGAVLTALRAEAVGFEPTVTSLPRRFSRPANNRARLGP